MKRIFFVYILVLFISMPSISGAVTVGPYTGRVTDSQTGDPVEGASVLCYWIKEIPQIFESKSELIKVILVSTGKDGTYDIPEVNADTGLFGILESTNLIIYQPGYQAYIMTVWHNSRYEQAKIFRERDNIVKLDRIPPNFSHREHYEKIEDALRGIDLHSSFYPEKKDPDILWNKLVETDLKSTPEKEEFLRRAEWEKRRGQLEDRK